MKPLLVLLLVGLAHSQEELSNPDCNHWLNPGDCNNFTIKWYYDRYDHRCRRFHYSGCGGNSNNFNSLEECSASCTYTPPSTADRCSLPHEPGHCNSDIERWFFDWDKKQCVCSYWTGCGGNSNLFYSYNHCMEICGEFSHPWIGPGIDEKYWGVLNKSTMSPENQAIFVNKPAFVYPPDAWWNPVNAPLAQPNADILDNDYFSDYREMTASETKAEIPIVARGAKTITVEHPIPELPPAPRRTKKIRKQKVPPRRITQIILEGPTTPTPTAPQSTFSHTYYTDSRGNQINAPTASTPARNYQPAYQNWYSQSRTQVHYPQHTPATSAQPVLPTQFYVTYKTDQYGRQVWNQKIWWTGDGPMPIQALRARYPYWLPPPYDGFGKNPYEDNGRIQDNRRWNAVPVTPETRTYARTTPFVPPPTTLATTSTTTTTPAPTTLPPTTLLPTTTPTQPVITTRAYYTPSPPMNVWTTPRPYIPNYSVQTTVPTWIRRYPSTTPPPVYPTRYWWAYTTTSAPARTRPPTPEPTLRQFVRQPPSYIPVTDMPPNHFERPLIHDMSTRPVFTTPRSFTPVRTATAEPIEFQRWLVQRITTEKPELSIDDIIALDEETYDDYDMQMEPDEQDKPHQPVTLPPRTRQPISPSQRRPPPASRNDAWKPIVMPPPSHRSGTGTDYANSVDFEIQSHGDT